MSHRPAFPRDQNTLTFDEECYEAARSCRRVGTSLYTALHNTWKHGNNGAMGTSLELKELCSARWPKGPPSKAWLEKANKARTALSNYWEHWRGIIRIASKQMWPGLYTDTEWPMLNVLKFDLRDEHKQYVREEEDAVRAKIGSGPRKRKSPEPERPEEPVLYIPHASASASTEKF